MAIAGAVVASAFAVTGYSARCHALPSSTASGNTNLVNLPNTVTHPPLFIFPQLSGASNDNLNHIVNPSLKFANVLWFKGAYNAQIFVSEDESPDSVVRRFRKVVMQAGVIPECRRRRYFETPQDIAKRKLQAAQRRNKTRRFTPRPDALGPKESESSSSVVDDDFWGYAEE